MRKFTREHATSELNLREHSVSKEQFDWSKLYLNTHNFNPNIIDVISAKQQKIHAASYIVKSNDFLPIKQHFYGLRLNNSVTG
jgi:hypothetical protein